MERRTFIKHTAAIASVAAIGAVGEARAEPVIGAVLVDRRFSDSQRFAKIFEARGANVFSLDDDIARLWYDTLRPLCAQAGTTIVGLTQHSDLFISEEFARESGRLLRPFGMHDCRRCRTLTHVIPEETVLDLHSSAAWPEQVALQLINRPEFGASSVTLESNTIRSIDHPGSLFSWIIK